MARNTSYTLYVTGRTDPTYRHIWAFADQAERTAFLTLKTHNTFPGNKYWRVGESIKIPVSYEDSFQYDYVVITNRPGTEDEQTYYCFITARAYLSKNATLLNVEIDYVQTYYFSHAIDGGVYPFWQVSGFLESATYQDMHAPRATASQYPVPATVCSSFQTTMTSASELFAIVIYSTYDLATLYTSDTVRQQTAVLSNIPLTAVPYMIVGSTSTNLANTFNTLMSKVNSNALTDSITACYVIPVSFVNLASTPLNTVTAGWVLKAVSLTLTKPTTCGGYTPVNSELLGYDYSYFFVSNGAGEIQNYHYEDFEGNPNFEISMSLVAGFPVITARPTNYKFGSAANFRSYLQKITTPIFCSYLNDSYKIWLAQTQNSRQAAINGGQLAISQAEEARSKSWTYQSGQTILDTESRLREYLPGKMADFSGGVASLFGNDRKTRGVSVGRSFGDVSIPYNGGVQVITPTYSSPYGDDQKVWQGLYDIGVGYINKQLGIESIYTYDHAVANAQQSLNQLLAGYRDQAAIPATATGSNAYGDLTTFQQYAFMLIGVTPTAEYAEWIDKMLSASGHTINRYLPGSLTKHHKTFDFVRLLSPHMEREQEYRPVFVHNLLINLLINGVYLWYLSNDGDISEYIGAPYGLENEVV